MSLKERHEQVIAYLRDGRFAEGIEDFYASDARASENGKPPTVGREEMARTERRFLQKVTAFHGIDVLATAIDDRGGDSGTVFYECVMRWDQSDRGAVEVHQTVVERWSDEKIVDIRFYGTFDPGPLPEES